MKKIYYLSTDTVGAFSENSSYAFMSGYYNNNNDNNDEVRGTRITSTLVIDIKNRIVDIEFSDRSYSFEEEDSELVDKKYLLDRLNSLKAGYAKHEYSFVGKTFAGWKFNPESVDAINKFMETL